MSENVAATLFEVTPYYIGFTYTMYKSFLKATFRDSLREIINLQSHARVQQVLRSRRKPPSSPVSRNTMIYTHMHSENRPNL